MKMKNIGKYMFLLFAVAVGFASCEKSQVDPSNEIELIPEAGYIRFSTGVATKAPIILNMRGKNFGVLGYNYGYSTKWEVARALAKPGLFYNLPVGCDENGVCTYDVDAAETGNQYEPWNLSQKYSFFAYYPIMSESQGTISISGENDVNMPTVTYSLPLKSQSEGEVNPDDLLDLMTAYSIDKTAGDGTVGFSFQHRLFCIEVLAQNYNTTNTITAADGSTTEIDADEKISNLKLTIDNIASKTITVPMMRGYKDKGENAVPPVLVANDKGAVDFRLLSTTESVLVPSHDQSAGAVSLSGADGNKIVMLIPQDATSSALKGTLTFDLTNSVGTTETVTRTFESELNFQEGKKYTMTINFTGKTIVIAVGEAGAWEPHSVNFDFE